MVAHSGIRLHLIGEDDGDIELFRKLLKTGEVLVEFLQGLEMLASSPEAYLLSLRQLASAGVVLSCLRQPDSTWSLSDLRKRFMILSTMMSL